MKGAKKPDNGIEGVEIQVAGRLMVTRSQATALAQTLLPTSVELTQKAGAQGLIRVIKLSPKLGIYDREDVLAWVRWRLDRRVAAAQKRLEEGRDIAARAGRVIAAAKPALAATNGHAAESPVIGKLAKSRSRP